MHLTSTSKELNAKIYAKTSKTNENNANIRTKCKYLCK